MAARADPYDDDPEPERYSPSPERRAEAIAAKDRAQRLVVIVSAVIAITGLVAAVAIGLSTH
jgi:hypothetical protein